ncbi:MAG: hypothetical protein QM756_25555 [Polyangiaceae bacterium]
MALGLGAAAYLWLQRPSPKRVTPPVASTPPPAASTLADPLFPERTAALAARAALEPDWVSSGPKAQYQYSWPASKRDGVEPCATPAPDEAKNIRAMSRGFLFGGGPEAIDAEGKFDLVIHFNGEGPVRRELLASAQPFVLFTYTLPPSDSYAPHFAGSKLMTRLIEEITMVLERRHGRKVKLGHLALSAWSAGFEGIRSILFQREAERVEAILLIDGLHAPRGQTYVANNLAPFVAFARKAAKKERFFAITHSSIPTYDFISTTESAHFLEQTLAGKPTRVERNDGFGLELIEQFDVGDLHVRGYAGNDKADHCAQLFLLRSLFTALHRHFHPAPAR